MPWPAGRVTNMNGRPKGLPNKTTVEQREFSKAVLGLTPETFAQYVTMTRVRLLAGMLPPAIEALILHYRFGKPVERVDVRVEDTSDLKDELLETLAERAKALAVLVTAAGAAAEESSEHVEQPTVQ